MVAPLTAAVVGGGLGGRLSLDALRASDRFEAIAVADIDAGVRARLAEQYPDLRIFPDHRSLLETAAPEVVCVSTDPTSHEDVTLEALRHRPRGLLVEKPLAPSTDAGTRILDAIRGAGIPVVVPHGLLVQATATEVIRRVVTGDIGELQLIEVRTTGWDIINAGIHWLNLCGQLLGSDRFAHVIAQCDTSSQTYRDGMQVETIAMTYLESQGGVRVVMLSGDHVRMPEGGALAHFKVIGSRGRIDFDGFQEGYHIVDPGHPGGLRVDPVPRPGTGHQRHLESLADQIATGVVDDTVARGSLAALEACEAAYLSNRHGCRVDLPLATFTVPDATAWDPGRPYAGTGGGRDGRAL